MTMSLPPLDNIDAYLEPLTFVELNELIEKAQKRQARLRKSGARALIQQFDEAAQSEFGISAAELLATTARKRRSKDSEVVAVEATDATTVEG